MKKTSESRIEFWGRGGQAPRVMVCDKQNLPPDNPTGASVSASGLVVTLSWTDASNDEIGFKIMKKGSVTGNWSAVTTTVADVVSYEDTVSTAGTYWYRIKATGSNGDSIGTKVVKLTLAE